jgi:hypothetical protein
MKSTGIQSILDKIDLETFTSSAHLSQHRILGFITTNLRTPKTFTDYIGKLLPKYIEKKNNLGSWEKWVSDRKVLDTYKQMFKRLEIAKILFRKVKDSPHLNDIGEKLYRILQKNDGDRYLTFILHLYLLTGRYFDIDNQPLVEIEKILAAYNGDIVQDSIAVIKNKSVNRLFFVTLFYNPSVPGALDLAHDLLENDKFSQDDLDYLTGLLPVKKSLLGKRITIAGGIGNFRSDVAIILNYHLFKTAWQKYTDNAKYEDVVAEYIDLVFKTGLNEYFNIKNKASLLEILQDTKNRTILKDIVEFALGIKFDNSFVRRPEKKNIRQTAFEKYGHKCFFDCYSEIENEHLAHRLNYFKTKKSQVYLEGHHMVQMENSKFFEKDVDVLENIIPVCPNCHRKLHNADPKTVMRMLQTYYNKSDKEKLMRKGIFVDIDTLARFYGIEEQ